MLYSADKTCRFILDSLQNRLLQGDPANQTDTLVTYLYKLAFYNGKQGGGRHHRRLLPAPGHDADTSPWLGVSVFCNETPLLSKSQKERSGGPSWGAGGEGEKVPVRVTAKEEGVPPETEDSIGSVIIIPD